MLKNTLEQGHLACKPANLLKMNFFTNIFQEFPLDFKSLFIVLEFQEHLFFKIPFNVGFY